MDFDELSPLDEMDILLREMYALAWRAAQAECEDSERMILQERMDALVELYGNARDRLMRELEEYGYYEPGR